MKEIILLLLVVLGVFTCSRHYIQKSNVLIVEWQERQGLGHTLGYFSINRK